MKKGLRVLVLAALVAGCATVTGVAASPASAGLLSCDGQTAPPAFSRWLDPIPYTPVPGGDFEGAHGWKLSGGATVVSGNDPFYLRPGSSRSTSLRVRPRRAR